MFTFARKNIFLHFFQVSEKPGGVFEFFIFDQLAHQIPARIVFVIFFHRPAIFVGQQQAAFNHHQRRGHHDKIAGDLKVEDLHQLEIFHVLGGDPPDRNVVDVHLVFFDEIE